MEVLVAVQMMRQSQQREAAWFAMPRAGKSYGALSGQFSKKFSGSHIFWEILLTMKNAWLQWKFILNLHQTSFGNAYFLCLKNLHVKKHNLCHWKQAFWLVPQKNNDTTTTMTITQTIHDSLLSKQKSEFWQIWQCSMCGNCAQLPVPIAKPWQALQHMPVQCAPKNLHLPWHQGQTISNAITPTATCPLPEKSFVAWTQSSWTQLWVTLTDHHCHIAQFNDLCKTVWDCASILIQTQFVCGSFWHYFWIVCFPTCHDIFHEVPKQKVCMDNLKCSMLCACLQQKVCVLEKWNSTANSVCTKWTAMLAMSKPLNNWFNFAIFAVVHEWNVETKIFESIIWKF